MKITIDNKYLDDKQSDFFHYQETIELAKCEYGTFYIMSCGELKVSYTNQEKGIINERNIDDIQRYYVTNDDEYIQAQYDNTLDIILGNWFELDLVDDKGNRLDHYYTDEVFGTISECIDAIKDLKEEEILWNK